LEDAMSISRLEELAVATPPPGVMSLSVARHITETGIDVMPLHKRRAKLVGNLVNELSLEVKDWGNTKAPVPREIVTLLVVALAPAVVSAAATIIAAWIGRPAKNPSASESLLGIKLKAADGEELTVTYLNTAQGEAATLIEAFMTRIAGRQSNGQAR
jgi:hypothetical protein